MKPILLITTILSVLLIGTHAQARSNRVSQVPNGGRFDCEVCHTEAGGLNNFGFHSFDYTNVSGNVEWGPELAALDSDKDGYSNGVELGDPTGSWRTGNSNPGGTITNPGDKSENACGNGTMETNEECEGGELNGESCASLELGEGTLRCSSTCTYDVGSCGSCGDMISQPFEECDGTDFADATCEALGYTGGSLSCSNTCSLDVSGCAGAPAGPVCGDSTISGSEFCDTTNLGGLTCTSLGFKGGPLACSAICEFDTTSCFGGIEDTKGPGEVMQGDTPTEGSDTEFEFTGRACMSAGMSKHSPLPSGLAFGLIMLGVAVRQRRS